MKNIEDMTIPEMLKESGMPWLLFVEIILIILGIISIYGGNYIQAILLFILVEIREVSFLLKRIPYKQD